MRFFRAVAALAVLLALLIGAPIGLWTWGRSLLPTSTDALSLSAIWQALTSRDDGSLFLGALLIVGTIAWLVFAVCVVTELAALIAGRAGKWHLPGLRMPQKAVSALLATIFTGSLMAMSVGTAGAAPAPPAAVAEHTIHQQQQPSPVDRQAEHPTATQDRHQHPGGEPRQARSAAASSKAAPTWTVGRYDTLWSIADKTLGDGRQFNKIVDLNRGVPQADGRVLESSDTPLEIGWILRLPAGAHAPAAPTPVAEHTVQVKQGDTLSAIAQEELGDATLYPTLAKVNDLSNPDDLEVGQSIVIPGQATATASGKPTQQPAAPTAAPEAETEKAIDKAAEPKTKEAAAKPADKSTGGPVEKVEKPAATAPKHVAPDVDAAASELAAAAARVAQATATAITTATSAATGGAVTSTTDQRPAPGRPPAATSRQQAAAAPTVAQAAVNDDDSNSIVLIGLAAITAAAAAAGLAAVRRRAHRRHRLGTQPKAASLPEVRLEKALRTKADGVDVAWLDQALRSVSNLLAGNGSTSPPDVTAATLAADHLHLRIAGTPPTAPVPFLSSDDGWTLPGDAALPLVESAIAPYPALASIGTGASDETVLLDLERAGALAVTGDTLRCTEFLTHLAVELAHNIWSDGLAVTLVGWGSDLIALNTDRLTYAPTVADAARELAARTLDTTAAQASLGTDVIGGRVNDVVGDTWAPQVLLVDATAAPTEDLQALDDAIARLLEAGRTTTAIVVTGTQTPLGAVEVVLAEDGALSIPALWPSRRITAARVTATEAHTLLGLFAAASAEEEPIPPATSDQPWAKNIDASGALLRPVLDHSGDLSPWAKAMLDAEERTTAAEVDADHPVPAQTAHPTDVPAAESETAAGADDRVVSIHSAAIAANVQLEQILSADPTLDEDLVDWHADPLTRPRIAILGPPQVEAPGNRPPHRPAWFTQVAVYLALHENGVTADKLATDLWPAEKQPSAKTRRETLSRLRTWMGRNPNTGEPYMPAATDPDATYRLTGRLLDLELLARLRARAQARAQAGDTTGAQSDYTTALGLVRGHSELEWPWMVNPDRMENRLVPSRVGEIAHDAAQLALTHQDLDTARAAAEVGYLAAPEWNVPLRDLFEIACAAGQMETARALALKILEQNEAEELEDLVDHDTYRVIDAAFPTGLHKAATG